MKQIIILMPLFLTFLFTSIFGDTFILGIFSNPYLGVMFSWLYNCLMVQFYSYYQARLNMLTQLRLYD